MAQPRQLTATNQGKNMRFEGSKIAIYSSSPVKALCGYAKIDLIKHDNPEKIWDKYHNKIGCTKEEFDEYTKDCEKIYAIFLCNIERYINSISLNQLSFWLNKDLHPPQSYSTFENDKHWAGAVSIAELLHGRFQTFTSLT